MMAPLCAGGSLTPRVESRSPGPAFAPVHHRRREPAAVSDWRLRSPRRSRCGTHPCHRVTTASDGSFDARHQAGRLRRGSGGTRVYPALLRRTSNMPEMPVHVNAGQSATSIGFGSNLRGVERPHLLMRATGLPASRLSCSDAAASPSAHARLPSPSRRRRTWGPSAFATSLRASITFGRTSRSMVPTRGAGALVHRDVLSGRDRRDAGATRSRGRRRGACRHRFRAGHGQEARTVSGRLPIRLAAHWPQRPLPSCRSLQPKI